MRVFLSNTADVPKALSNLHNQSYDDIVSKYSKAFPDFYKSFDVSPAKTKVLDFQKFLKKGLTNLKVINNFIF